MTMTPLDTMPYMPSPSRTEPAFAYKIQDCSLQT